MSDIKEIKETIASRTLEFVDSEGGKETVVLKVGMPFEQEEESWCCPYELSSESYVKRFGMVGIDSVQALELTMKTLNVEIEYWERSKKGKFYFLGELGAGI